MPVRVVVYRFLIQGVWIGMSGGAGFGGGIGVAIVVLFGLIQGISALLTDPLRDDFAAVMGVSVPLLGAAAAWFSVARLAPATAGWADRAIVALVGALVGGTIGLGPFAFASLLAYFFGSIVGVLSGVVLGVSIALSLAILTISRHHPLIDERRYRREARATAALVVFALSGPGLAVVSSVEDGIDWAWTRDLWAYSLVLSISSIAALYTLWLTKYFVQWYVSEAPQRM